jgi:hypothetical protein
MAIRENRAGRVGRGKVLLDSRVCKATRERRAGRAIKVGKVGKAGKVRQVRLA